MDAARAVVARRRRRRAAADRRTLALGLFALAGGGGVIASEVARVWRRGSGDAGEATRQTVQVAVAGYRDASRRETALLNMLGSFTLSFGAVRATTHVIRTRGRLGPMRNVRLGRRHIHHFVPGIVLAFLAGGISIAGRNERLSPWLALPFGSGLALTLDESALLLELDDVYWSERGVISVQITLGAVGILSTLALTLRALRRGEGRVLDGGGAADAYAQAAPGPAFPTPTCSESEISRPPRP